MSSGWGLTVGKLADCVLRESIPSNSLLPRIVADTGQLRSGRLQDWSGYRRPTRILNGLRLSCATSAQVSDEFDGTRMNADVSCAESQDIESKDKEGDDAIMFDRRP